MQADSRGSKGRGLLSWPRARRTFGARSCVRTGGSCAVSATRSRRTSSGGQTGFSSGETANASSPRAALRDALSRYVGVAPRPLCFSCDSYGKPSLRDEAGRARLRFNASHSNGLALYAVTPGREVGVDLEFVREEFARESYRAALAVEGAPTALRCRRRPGGVS